MKLKNLFSDIPHSISDEIFETILENPDFKLERIVSTGQSTPEKKWLEQDWDEWVILLAGSAALVFEREQELRIMNPGDYIFIPAYTRHRVEWTDKQEKTIWLALHARKEKA